MMATMYDCMAAVSENHQGQAATDAKRRHRLCRVTGQGSLYSGRTSLSLVPKYRCLNCTSVDFLGQLSAFHPSGVGTSPIL